MLNKLKLIVLLLMLVGAGANAQQAINKEQIQPQPPDTPAAQAKPKTNTQKLTYKIIEAPNKTYCYDIYGDGILKIHQPNIPAVPGNEGFKSKADAEKVAQLVIKKIKKGEMPPTVSVEELKKLKVIK